MKELSFAERLLQFTPTDFLRWCLQKRNDIKFPVYDIENLFERFLYDFSSDVTLVEFYDDCGIYIEVGIQKASANVKWTESFGDALGYKIECEEDLINQLARNIEFHSFERGVDWYKEITS